MGFTLYVVLYGLLALPDNGSGRDVYLVDAYDSKATAETCGQHFPFIAAIAQLCDNENCIDINLCNDERSADPCDDLKFAQAPLQGNAEIRLEAKVGDDEFIDLSSGQNKEGDLSKIWPLGRHLNVARVDHSEVAAHLRLGDGRLDACSLSFIRSQSGRYEVGTFRKIYYNPSRTPFHQSELIESALWSRELINSAALRVSINENAFDLEPVSCFDDPDELCIYLYFANPSNRFPYNHHCVRSLEYDAAHFGHYLNLFERPATTTPKVVSTRWTDSAFFCNALEDVPIPAVPEIDNRCDVSSLGQQCKQGLLNVTDRAACPIVQ